MQYSDQYYRRISVTKSQVHDLAILMIGNGIMNCLTDDGFAFHMMSSYPALNTAPPPVNLSCLPFDVNCSAVHRG